MYQKFINKIIKYIQIGITDFPLVPAFLATFDTAATVTFVPERGDDDLLCIYIYIYIYI